MHSKNRTLTYRVAVVIPIFKHSVLATEAIESSLNQKTNFNVLTLLINDGCPYSETGDICTEYAATFPDRVVYIHKKNGGLSSARNFGIAYVLDNHPEIDAIYFLDADNRLRPNAIAKAMQMLDADDGCDWIYPNIDMFGIRESFDYGGSYSLLVHSAINICEAGSLVRRRVFESGVFFDTQLKLGFEDWDFFLSAAELGFRGKNLDEMGFLYRRRPESMLADANRAQAEIKAGLFRKHKNLLNPKKLVQLENDEAPRYALYLHDRNCYMLCLDPDFPLVTLQPEEYSKLIWTSVISPGRIYAPPFLIATSSQTISALKKSKLLHWTLWRLEIALKDVQIATASVDKSEGEYIEIIECNSGEGAHLNASMVMIENSSLTEILFDKETLWIDSLINISSIPSTFNIKVCIPPLDGINISVKQTSIHAFLYQIRALFESPYKISSQVKWDWRKNGVQLFNKKYEIGRTSFNGNPTFPKINLEKKQIGFLLPLVEFGGVEKVTLNIARELKNTGWIPHLFVLEQHKAALSKEWFFVFESISFSSSLEGIDWTSKTAYQGTLIHERSPLQQDRELSLLYWMDVVVNCHCSLAHSLMAKLKNIDVVTVASLHLSDLSLWNRPVGHTYLALAYEHAYDYFTTCSKSLANWCHGMGIPDEKIIPVLNAPGYEISLNDVQHILKHRIQFSTNRALRVLYIGRFDRQKSLHRLLNIIEKCNNNNLNVEWRMVGKGILEDRKFSDINKVKVDVYPAVYSPEELTDHYRWADVLLLVSEYEGLPLTVLEAMRLGVVPICSDVGALSEVITSDQNGYLVSRETCISDSITIIQSLTKNRKKLLALSQSAAQGLDNWDASVEVLDQKLAGRIRSFKLDPT